MAEEKVEPKSPKPWTQWLQTAITVLSLILGGFGATAYMRQAANQTPAADIVVDKFIKGKKCELNKLTIVSNLKVKFFMLDDYSDRWTYEIAGNVLSYVPKSYPIKLWVTGVKDGEMVEPIMITINEDGKPPVPGPLPPPGPGPGPGPTPNPNDSFETALRTAWQAEFSADKGQTRQKLIQLYQYLNSQLSTTVTYGDLAGKLTTKANELQVVGKAPTFQGTLNTELSKLMPHSPSLLVDAVATKATFDKTINVLNMLSP